MKTKKMGTYKKMGLILLAGAAGGGLFGALLGAGMELYGSGLASGVGTVLSVLQRVGYIAVKCNSAPSGHIAGIVHGCKCNAVAKRKVSNARYGIANSDGGEARASRECRLTDARYRIGNSDGGEAHATLESILTDARYRIGDSNKGEARANRESRLTNACYRIGNSNRGEIRNIIKSIIPNCSDPLFNYHFVNV